MCGQQRAECDFPLVTQGQRVANHQGIAQTLAHQYCGIHRLQLKRDKRILRVNTAVRSFLFSSNEVTERELVLYIFIRIAVQIKWVFLKVFNFYSIMEYRGYDLGHFMHEPEALA